MDSDKEMLWLFDDIVRGDDDHHKKLRDYFISLQQRAASGEGSHGLRWGVKFEDVIVVACLSKKRAETIARLGTADSGGPCVVVDLEPALTPQEPKP